MLKILIITDGIVGNHLLERVMGLHTSTHQYRVVTSKEETLPQSIREHLEVMVFDPTSRSKLRSAVDDECMQVMIVLENQEEALEVVQIIRHIKHNLHIVLLDFWGIQSTLLNVDLANNVTVVRSFDLLVGRMIDLLPSVPLVAQNIGLGIGEIMEVLVPVGSVYAYRHLSSIDHKNARIVGLYRNGQFMLSKQNLMIRPNDSLLLAGNPSILSSIYKAIKSAHGQFPSPYGRNIYCLIDMSKEDDEGIRKLVDEALFLHGHLKNIKLIFRVLNPTASPVLHYIKSFLSREIMIDVLFQEKPYEDILRDDQRYNMGLIVVSKKLFECGKLRFLLHALGKPVLKTGEYSVGTMDQLALLISETPLFEQISTAIFDFANQLNCRLSLCDFDPEESKATTVVEHYTAQANLSGRKLEVMSSEGNPIREILTLGRFIQIIPFSKEVLKQSWVSIFTTSIESLHWKLQQFPQLFLPVEEKH